MSFKKIIFCFWLLVNIFMHQANSGEILINISVDWEGRGLHKKNLDAMKGFRSQHPNIPLLHYMNAAYFTKKNSNQDKTARNILSALSSNDEIGLHIHGWKSLVEASGVSYRSSPSWSPYTSEICAVPHDCGHGVPITAYNTDEIRKIIRTSVKIMQRQGLPVPTMFRAGGWMAGPNVLKALTSEGFKMDASQVPRQFLRYQQPTIYQWLGEIWPTTSSLTQPYKIWIDNHSNIVEFPNNGCLADYMTGAKMHRVFLENVKQWREDQSQHRFISIGFHQETASNYINRVKNAISRIEKYAKRYNVPVKFIANPLEYYPGD